MYPPAINDSCVEPRLVAVLRAFLIERSEWIGRVQWWYEGESPDEGTLRVKAIYPGGHHSARRQCKTDESRQAAEWLCTELVKLCQVGVWNKEDASAAPKGESP